MGWWEHSRRIGDPNERKHSVRSVMGQNMFDCAVIHSSTVVLCGRSPER